MQQCDLGMHQLETGRQIKGCAEASASTPKYDALSLSICHTAPCLQVARAKIWRQRMTECRLNAVQPQMKAWLVALDDRLQSDLTFGLTSRRQVRLRLSLVWT